ncbi:MAG: rhomboid family intramembrane serine protease [Armatimonadetes bacterium]|nr:rhomboid family intramembrane serine protease [Armatimonadota bacterium]
MALRNPLATKNFPVATYSLIAFNVLLWWGLLGSNMQDEIFPAYALTPRDPGLLQMFTSMFLHQGFGHLAGNMFFLWLFGRRIELALGSVEFLIFYIGSGFAASIMHLAIVFAFLPPDAKTQHVVGASGAIAGILGVYAIRYYRDSFNLGGVRVPASVLLLGWLMMQMVLGILSLYVPEINLGIVKPQLASIGYWAHLGGFIFGMGFAQMSQLGLEARKEYLLSDAQEGMRRGTLMDVARDYEELLECDPEDPFAYAELGRTWSLLGDPEQAIPYYEKAIRLYLTEDRTDLAVERFREMRASWPEAILSLKLHFRMGCKLEEIGEYEEAVTVLEQLSHAEARSAEGEMAALRVGEIYLSRLHRTDAAISAFRRFLRLYPDSQWAHFAEQSLNKAGAE